MKQWLLASGLLWFAACAQPTAMTPTASLEEISAERNRQMKMAHGSVKSDYDEVSFSKTDINAMQARLQRVVNQLAPEATKLCREMNGPQANCNLYVELTKGKGLNAHADGEKIVIYMSMVDFAKDDDELAFVLAHEYTHHMMGHVQSAKQNVLGGALLGTLADALAASQGISTSGQFGKMGAQASMLAYSPAFETEADYIALYMLERAKFNINDAPNFWRRMAQNNPQGIYNRTTHPTTPERFVMMSKTIDEINAKKQRGVRLLPNLKPKS